MTLFLRTNQRKMGGYSQKCGEHGRMDERESLAHDNGESTPRLDSISRKVPSHSRRHDLLLSRFNHIHSYHHSNRGTSNGSFNKMKNTMQVSETSINPKLSFYRDTHMDSSPTIATRRSISRKIEMVGRDEPSLKWALVVRRL